MKPRPLYAVETKVAVTKARTEIEQTLTRFGARSFAYALQPGRAVVMFELGDRHIRFDMPVPADATDKTARQLWRALFLSIKAKLVSVDTGIESLEEAFLAHIVLANGKKVYENVREGNQRPVRHRPRRAFAAGRAAIVSEVEACYRGSDGERTRALYAKLTAVGPAGRTWRRGASYATRTTSLGSSNHQQRRRRIDMAHQPGPKELQARALREQRFEQREAGKKASTSDLRKKIANVKRMTKHGGRRGR